MTGKPHSFGCGLSCCSYGCLPIPQNATIKSALSFFMSNSLIYSAMKKLFLFAVLMLSLASCKTLTERFDSFVTEVETNYETYSDVDWKAIEQKYAEFENEYISQYDKLNEEEKAFFKKRMGAFDAVLTKVSIKNAAKGVERFFKDAGDYVEGLIEGFVSSSDSTVVSE